MELTKAALEKHYHPEPTTGCWLWTGANKREGYGHLVHRGRYLQAHRVMYELYVGPIPEGLQIDHVQARGCASPACVNPAHLEPVTTAENTRRGRSGQFNRNKTHCRYGHPLVLRKLQRVCKVCDCAKSARYRARVSG